MISFRHPCTILIAGPTQSGKTFFFKQILAHNLIQPPATRILYVNTGEIPPELQEFPQIEYIKGLEKLLECYENLDPLERNLVVIDDQMAEAGNSTTIGNLFSKGSHHKNITVIYIVQNLFDKGRVHRTISLNSHYVILFKNARDKGQIRTLAQQVFPNKVKFIVEAFEEATKEPYGYLMLDCHPQTPEELRVRGNIFKGDDIEIYLPAAGPLASSQSSDTEVAFSINNLGYIKGV